MSRNQKPEYEPTQVNQNVVILKPAIVGLLTGAIGLLLGFGSSQVTVVRTVERNSAEINFSKQEHITMRNEIAEERRRNDERIKSVVATINENSALSRDLIQLVQVQIKLLERKATTNP